MESETKDLSLNTKDLIASLRHTYIMIVILIIFSVSGFISNTSSAESISNSSKIILYFTITLGEWALVYYMWIGIKKAKKISLINLISSKASLEFRLNDFLKGLIFWIVANAILYTIKYLLNLPLVSNSNANLLPHTYLEYTSFFILALSAGFCEEIIYRGYFQKQFIVIFKNKWVAILLQGVLFGVSHGYQGTKYIIVISVYGILFGLLTNFVKNLKPGIIAHSWQDIFSGILYQGS